MVIHDKAAFGTSALFGDSKSFVASGNSNTSAQITVANNKVKYDLMIEAGDKAQKKSKLWYIPTFMVSIVPSVPLLVSIPFVYNQRTIIYPLIVSSYVMVMVLVAMSWYLLCKYKEYPVMKARGKTFIDTIHLSTFMLLTFNFALLIVFIESVNSTEDSTVEVVDISEAYFLPFILLLCMSRLARTIFLTSMISRLYVVYKIFQKGTFATITKKKVTKYFRRPMYIFLGVQLLLIIPLIVLSVLGFVTKKSSYDKSINVAYLTAMWVMIVVRGMAIAYFIWKVRNVNTLFSDYAQNIRAGIVDLLAMISIAAVWTTMDLSPNSIIASQFCYQVISLSYLLDAFLFPIYHAYKDTKGKLSTSTGGNGDMENQAANAPSNVMKPSHSDPVKLVPTLLPNSGTSILKRCSASGSSAIMINYSDNWTESLTNSEAYL